MDRSNQLELAQRFVSDQLWELSVDPTTKIDAFAWDWKEIQYGTEVYPLTIILDGNLKTLNFADEELMDETPEGRERLKGKVEGFLREE